MHLTAKLEKKILDLRLTIDEFCPVDNSKIVIQFALGVAGENLFALFRRKKFGTKDPTRQLAGNAHRNGGQAQINFY
ncbi:MAG: hypothetical protein Q8K04_09155 [Lutibacter sp.]|nr:hypothetical protein [Lutibacter sp.]